jgi:hypothetical protein
MQLIKTYLYPNLMVVQFVDPTLRHTGRNRIVYSRTIKVYQGIDNPVQIVTLNQDQKPVDLTGYALQVDIQDPVNQLTVASYPVTFTTITSGQGYITLDNATISSLQQRIYKLTVKQINTNTSEASPMYIDDNYGVPLDMVVLPAYYSTTAPSVTNNTEVVVDGGSL